ncbi:hypothetical protein E4U53_007282 [Claviceps sorghi]|nr:hypothetical protein E4U53_007282 [Claviceps sorghi]
MVPKDVLLRPGQSCGGEETWPEPVRSQQAARLDGYWILHAHAWGAVNSMTSHGQSNPSRLPIFPERGFSPHGSSGGTMCIPFDTIPSASKRRSVEM